ncbi:hypothetical protein HDU97_000962 [Phlyctochytrium planicorne]|nr:hypothetical protein HDU97_000962 [Phlyctochytrium planicorne]
MRLVPLFLDMIGLAAILAAVKRIGRFELATEKVPNFAIRLILAQLLTLGDFTLDTLVDFFRKYAFFFKIKRKGLPKSPSVELCKDKVNGHVTVDMDREKEITATQSLGTDGVGSDDGSTTTVGSDTDVDQQYHYVYSPDGQYWEVSTDPGTIIHSNKSNLAAASYPTPYFAYGQWQQCSHLQRKPTAKEIQIQYLTTGGAAASAAATSALSYPQLHTTTTTLHDGRHARLPPLPSKQK